MRFVLETLRNVYKNDEISMRQDMTAQERLAFHQVESGPLMDKLGQMAAATIRRAHGRAELDAR